VESNSCIGVDSCYLTTGLTQIGRVSCIGDMACARLTFGTILEGSCVGVGTCSKPLGRDVAFSQEKHRRLNFTVGSNSCLGCYSCINSTAGKFFIEYAALVS
jgi:hypothetical protein